MYGYLSDNGSFAADDSVVVEGPAGQLAHRDAVTHLQDRLQTKFYSVGEGVWCFVGNGLSNQTFVLGPQGIIAIDTGECVEEMKLALQELRAVTDQPVVAVIYSHFHYVGGTQAVFDAFPNQDIPIWSHGRVPTNRLRTSGEIAPMYNRGLVHQFGTRLQEDGPDGLLSVGLGKFFRNPAHAPFTPGYVDPTNTFVESTVATIAGLRVEFTPAPSDADDSVNIWFPELNVCVHNIVWPTLFNVFAIRGEEYRDPRVLLSGLDHVAGLNAEHLVGAHGPPLSGQAHIRESVTDYRDSIQFLWDQTVRGLNKGLTADALTEFVQMPERFSRTYLTRQWYGVAEHHVRQIQTGLIGFFDGDEAALFPLPEQERAERLIAGFGGREEVRKQSVAALESNDLRWALELATWLVRSERSQEGRADGGSPEDRVQLAAVLRTIGQRSTAMNIRNWCLTRALELEGKFDLVRLRTHQFRLVDVAARPEASVRTLRVLLDPHLAEHVDDEIRFEFSGDPVVTTGLRIRKGVAVPTDGANATVVLALTSATWAKILSGKAHVSDCVTSGEVAVRQGEPRLALALLGCFDVPTLAAAAQGA